MVRTIYSECLNNFELSEFWPPVGIFADIKNNLYLENHKDRAILSKF